MCVKSLMLNVALIYVMALTQSYDIIDENCNNNNGVNDHGEVGVVMVVVVVVVVVLMNMMIKM